MFAHLMVIRGDSYPPTDDTETATLRGAMAPLRTLAGLACLPSAAVRLICWFPPGIGTVVTALYAIDKAKLGDVFDDRD